MLIEISFMNYVFYIVLDTIREKDFIEKFNGIEKYTFQKDSLTISKNNISQTYYYFQNKLDNLIYIKDLNKFISYKVVNENCISTFTIINSINHETLFYRIDDNL